MFARVSPYWLWLLLALPALSMITPFFDDNTRALRSVLHGSGEFSARFMIISMMATPLLMLTRAAALPAGCAPTAAISGWRLSLMRRCTRWPM